MMLLRCELVLVLSLAGAWPHFSQDARTVYRRIYLKKES
jgi:hypothetical protein